MQQAHAAAISRLADCHNEPGYGPMMQGLILQALFKLQEDHVIVQCLERDQALVREVVAAAGTAYQQQMGQKPTVEMSHEFLAPQESPDEPCLGGIVLWNKSMHICCRNTLNVRLQVAYDTQMPEIKARLFPNSIAAAPSNGDSIQDLLM